MPILSKIGWLCLTFCTLLFKIWLQNNKSAKILYKFVRIGRTGQMP